MEKNGYIYPGSVFLAKHFDQFTKTVKVHPFVCVYNQALDPDLNTENNILGLLITTKNKQAIRQIPVSSKKNTFLDQDCYCYCNNLYNFPRNDISVIGQLDSETFYQIVQKRQLLLRAENDQCVKSLMNMKSFESKKQVEKEAKEKINKVKEQLKQESKAKETKQKNNPNPKKKRHNKNKSNKNNNEIKLISQDKSQKKTPVNISYMDSKNFDLDNLLSQKLDEKLNGDK